MIGTARQHARDLAHPPWLRGIDQVRRAQGVGQAEGIGGPVDGDDPPSAGGPRSHDHAEPHPTDAEDDHVLPQGNVRPPDHRAEPRHRAAAQQGADLERCFLRDHDRRPGRDHRVVSKGGLAHEVVQRAAAGPEPLTTRHHRAVERRPTADVAQRELASKARHAITARDDDGADDVIADPHIGHPRTHLGDDAGALVTHHGWQRDRKPTLEHRHIGVAHAGGHQLDEDLPRSRFRRFDVLDLDVTDGAKYGGAHDASLVL